MSTLMAASHQWATRPDDQRFVSLTDLDGYTQNLRANSNARVISSRRIEADVLPGDNKSLIVKGERGNATLSNFSFGQLAARVGAPAGYLRTLPGPLAADAINYGLHTRDVEDIGVLLTLSPQERQAGALAEMRAVTGPNYGRIWNADITRALVRQFGDGLTGQFRVPGEFGKRVEITKANTTLYASDRDMFVFLADEEHRIEVPGRRDGQTGSLARGFFLWNSEVGAATMGIGTFLFDYVCQNRIVWGAEDYAEVRIRHTSGAPDRFIEEVRPALTAMANSSTHNVRKAIADARAARVDDLDKFFASRKYTRTQVSGFKAAHLADEGRPMETLWDVTTGMTAYARGLTHQDERVAIEREAGKVLALA